MADDMITLTLKYLSNRAASTAVSGGGGVFLRWAQSLHASEGDPNGWQWCKHEYIGAMRRDLGDPLGPNVPQLNPPRLTSEERGYLRTWRTQCAICGGCDLARVMTQSPSQRTNPGGGLVA